MVGSGSVARRYLVIAACTAYVDVDRSTIRQARVVTMRCGPLVKCVALRRSGERECVASALGGIGYLNDLWMLLLAGDWTWMGGSTQAQHVGTPRRKWGGYAVWAMNERRYLCWVWVKPGAGGPLNDLWVLDLAVVNQRQDVWPDLPVG